MIQVSSSLHFSLQKAGQGEAMNFSNEKSKRFTACLRLCAHWGFWDNRGCCPCFHAWPSLRGSNSTWAPPWSLSTQVMKLHSWIMAPQSCLLQLSPSMPTYAGSLGCSQQLQDQATQEAKAAVMDGCTGPSMTISSKWPHWEAPGLPEGLQCETMLPCPSQC